MKKQEIEHIYDQCLFISLNPSKKPVFRIIGYSEKEELSWWISVLSVKLCELLFKSIFIQTDSLLKEEIRFVNTAKYDLEIKKTEWEINILKSKVAK